MNTCWELVPDEEKQRVCKLEILDEVEELVMIQEHYCLTFSFTVESDLELWLQPI